MMSKCNLYFLLLAGTVCSSPVFATSFFDSTSTYTHTNQLELEPAFLGNSFKTASVCFLPDSGCNGGVSSGNGGDYSVDTVQQCLTEGYTKQNCGSLQIIDDVCPYNPDYGKGCKCKPGLVTCSAGQLGVGAACNGQYASCSCSSSLVSCASNQNGVGASCGGKYESCTCKSEYLYDSSNCSSPRSLSGNTCGGKYTGCSCPAGVSVGNFGCAEYYSSPCSGVCKAPNGDNCNARTSVNAPYGCMTYWSDCSSKCQTAYPDNCRSRTAVIASCPANATCSYFGDCSAKISSWTCNSGYTKSGNSCIQDKPKTCEDYNYFTKSPAGLGEKCVKQYVSEVGAFCYTDNCKLCPLDLYCAAGCAKYNVDESEADIYGCSRVCIECVGSSRPQPNCGSETLITCNGINYCCEPRFATCYYTTPHYFADGTTTYLCSVPSRPSTGTDFITGSDVMIDAPVDLPLIK